MVVPTTRPSLMHWQAAALTDRGRQRPRNEDAFLLRPDAQLYAVADGMGGHAAGDVASRLAVQTLSDAFPRPLAPTITPPTLSRRLVSAFETANSTLLRYAVNNPACAGMGTTLTTLVPLRATAQCVIAHVGDSRVYRSRGGALEQLTTDHTWVQQQVAAGTLTPAEARHHPYAPVLTRVLGSPPPVTADTYIIETQSDDTYLLCSDGLTAMIEDDDLSVTLARRLPLEQLARELIDAANRRGGRDNITAVVLRVSMSGD
jgi:protein phosphatase